MAVDDHRISRRTFVAGSAAAIAALACECEAVETASIVSLDVALRRLDATLRGGGKFRLFSFPLHSPVSDPTAGKLAWEGDVRGETKIAFDRFTDSVDTLFHKFRLFDAADKPVGSAKFADEPKSLPSSPPRLAWPASIKGVSCPVDVKDLIDLGAKHTHVNLDASALVKVEAAKRDEAFSRVVDGRRVYFNPGAIQALDRNVRALTAGGINAVGVVTNHCRTPGVLTHPKTDLKHAPNRMGAFNLTTDEAVAHYRGLMEFLSARYCRGDAAQGSIGGWIIGNEVQSAWEWHNMGPATLAEVTRQYIDELRVAYFAVRNAGAGVPVFASFDHFWAMPMSNDATRHHPGRALVDALGALSAREGNFPWHVAQHPYPENLFRPQFWLDKTATFANDSPRVTFKNVEVLAAYLRRKELLCDGKPRRLILPEQGFHAGDTTESEQIQAAAYAVAYRRLSKIPGVEAFILHRQVDADEGGLKLGIWPATGTGKRKRAIWDVVKSADTPRWQAASDFALPIAGSPDWAAVEPRRGPFPEHV